MTGEDKKGTERTRREFLATTTALAGAAMVGSAARSGSGASDTPSAAARCASARATIPSASIPIATSSTSSRSRWPRITGGLLDFDAKMESGRRPSPTEWDASADLKTWTFKLRRGAEFHNGETIDAQAIKWNIERILDPKIGHSFTRSALTDVERVTVDDKHTVRFHLKEPSAAFDTNLVYYPVNLMAPGAVDKADTHPVSCGPFKFKSWKRFDTCELVRFENFWETDAEGNTLPYLDGMIGKPKKEDRVRLTALRTNEVDLIDNVAYADAPNFIKEHGGSYDTWPVPQVGTAFIAFNLKNGPFSEKDNPDAHLLRMAAAHAIDHAGHPRSGVQQAGRDRQGLLQRGQPVARQGHRSRGRSSIPTRPRRCARRPRAATPSC